MTPIKATIDAQTFTRKPTGAEIARISTRIADSGTNLDTPENIYRLAYNVGVKGQTFCPATFSNGKRCKENFEQQQLFALDFDNKDKENTVTFREIMSRAEHYELPVLFAYETFSSTQHDKFRVVFMNDVSVSDRPVAEAMQYALSVIFPEADKSCTNDVSKMYFGGNHKDSLYFDNSIPKINIDSLFRSMTFYVHNDKGDKHYKEKLRRISSSTGIALNNNGLPDITITDELAHAAHLTEQAKGASTIDVKNGGNSPTPIIYKYIGHGENPPYLYKIGFNYYIDCTRNCSVSRNEARIPADNHKLYRSYVIEELDNCLLYQDFTDGTRKLEHDELFHILNNMINIETGVDKFMSVLADYPELYGDKLERWKEHADYNRKQGYYPSKCIKYCPYCNKCEHGNTILSTVHESGISMEPIDGHSEEFYPITEVENDVYNCINSAFMASDNKIHVIKAQTAIGKSSSFLRIMKENPDQRFIIAVPTNLLKEEMAGKAKRMELNILMTPSLEPLMDIIPPYLKKKIIRLYSCGRASEVHDLIEKTLAKEDIPCLKEYMKSRAKVKKSKCSLITTHRYLLSMDDKRLDEFDCIIIDEDIIFKSIITNQGEITLSELNQLKQRTDDRRIREKVSELLKCSRTQNCIHSNGFEWKYKGNGIRGVHIDIPSFCAAEYFYYRRAADEPGLSRDVLSYVKPASLTNRKHIIVSATADEDIYSAFFGSDRIRFYECKQAEYTGKLIQYHNKSMSRSCLQRNPEMISTIQSRLGLDSSHIITFKKESTGELHFGNTEGSNSLEGEDIAVIGTPYHTDFLYKLVAFSLDIDFDEDETAEMQVITHNGYRTRFTTYKDLELSKIQFWIADNCDEYQDGFHDAVIHSNCLCIRGEWLNTTFPNTNQTQIAASLNELGVIEKSKKTYTKQISQLKGKRFLFVRLDELSK